MDWKRDENSLVQWLANFVLLELPPWDDADILSAPMSALEVVHVMERMKRARGHDSGRTGELVKVMMPPFLPSDGGGFAKPLYFFKLENNGTSLVLCSQEWAKVFYAK